MYLSNFKENLQDIISTFLEKTKDPKKSLNKKFVQGFFVISLRLFQMTCRQQIVVFHLPSKGAPIAPLILPLSAGSSFPFFSSGARCC